MDRTERFYKIQALLKHRNGASMPEICAALEVSRATVCRDLDYLRDRLGVPVVWNRAIRRYVLEDFLPGSVVNPIDSPRQELPGVWFSEREIHALLTMVDLISQLEPEGLLSPRIEPLRLRLEQLLDQGTGSAQQAVNRIRILTMGQRSVANDDFQRLTHALISRTRLALSYYSRQTGETLSRVVSPQRLVYYRDNWYLDAYCHLREGLRSFAMDAIAQTEMLDEPAAEVEQTVLESVFESSYGIFNGPSRHVARLKFNPFRARWVARERWHPDQVSQYLPCGSYQLDVPYSEDWELIQDILKQGPDVEVIAPAALRDKVAGLINDMRLRYPM